MRTDSKIHIFLEQSSVPVKPAFTPGLSFLKSQLDARKAQQQTKLVSERQAAYLQSARLAEANQSNIGASAESHHKHAYKRNRKQQLQL